MAALPVPLPQPAIPGVPGEPGLCPVPRVGPALRECGRTPFLPKLAADGPAACEGLLGQGAGGASEGVTLGDLCLWEQSPRHRREHFQQALLAAEVAGRAPGARCVCQVNTAVIHSTRKLNGNSTPFWQQIHIVLNYQSLCLSLPRSSLSLCVLHLTVMFYNSLKMRHKRLMLLTESCVMVCFGSGEPHLGTDLCRCFCQLAFQ